ncbi:hypothetical protein HpBT039_10510 [Helicobacter pylori]
MKDLDKTSIVAIDFGTKSTTAIYMNKNGRYCLLSIGGDIDADGLEKYENPTIVEFRNKEKFLKAYNALDHRPFIDKQDMEVVHEAQKYFTDAKGNDLYRFFSQLKQWAGADEKQNFRDLFEDFSLESFAHCTDFNPIEIYAYYIGRCINNMHNGVFLKYFLSYPIKYEKHQAEKIRESFEKGLKKSLPRHVFDDDKTAKNFKVELRASEPCAYAISALKSYGFDKSAKLDKPIYYGVFDFGGGTTDFDFGKWEKSTNPKFAYKMTHFSSGEDKYLGGENLLEWLSFEAYAQNFQTLKEKDIVIAKPNYDRIDEQRFGSFMQKSREARLNLQTIASKLHPFLENLDAHIIEAIEENEEFEIGDLKKDLSKIMLFDRNGKDIPENELKIDYKELLELLKSKIDDGVDNFFAGFSKVMAENIDNQCRAFHIFSLEFLESLDLLFLYDKPSAHEIFSLCKELKNSVWDRKLVVALVEALEGFKDWNLSLKIEDNRSNSLGNGAKKLLTNADLESSHQKIVIDSMKTYHQSQQEKYKRERGQVQEVPTQTPPSYGGGSIRISGDKKPDSNEENF